MGRHKKKSRKKSTFKKRNVGIPQYVTGKETLENPCHLCGGEVIYTSNAVVYKGISRGLGVCYYCIDCEAMVSCNSTRTENVGNNKIVYSPKGILGNREMRDLRIRCHQLIDDKWKYRKIMKQSTAYRKLAIAMGIPFKNCHFGWMNLKQLQYALEVLTLTNWTKHRFD